MKGKPVLSWALALIVLFVTAIRCSDDKKTPVPTQNIVALASANTNLSSLVAALSKFPDLVSTLSGSGNFTVFAPTNQAFTALLAARGQTDINNVPDDVLKSILQYHVVTSGAVRSTQLTVGNVNTAANENIAVTINPIKLNTNTNVTAADVLASNGVVHIIDQVLVNPSILPIVGTIYAPAYFNKDFSTLVAAIKGASQSTRDLLLNSTNIVSKNNPLTIRLYTHNGSIVVANNLQEKEFKEESTQRGLQNIQSRYRLLSDEKVVIEKLAQEFRVTIPLLQLQ